MFDSTDTESLTCAEVSGRREMMAVLDYYQRVEKRPIILDHCSPLIGIREGYRIWGDYVLTVELVRRLRGELVFANVQALKLQIGVDVARVKRGI